MRKLLYAVLGIIAICACENETYESGDTNRSYFIAEFVDIKVKASLIQTIINDSDVSLPFESGLKIKNDNAPEDTTYRMLLYYNKVGNNPITIMNNAAVRVFSTEEESAATTTKRDPLSVKAVWQSANNKYINFTLGLATGETPSQNKKHGLSMVIDSVKQVTPSTKRYHYSLRHEQPEAPGYYTAEAYFSLPLAPYSTGDEIEITMPDKSGTTVKSFKKK